MSWIEKYRDPETAEWVYVEHGERPAPQRVSARKREKAITHRGAEPDFSKGPVYLFQEPMKGHGVVDAPHYAMGGMVGVVTNMRELREYEARNQHAGRNISWRRE